MFQAVRDVFRLVIKYLWPAKNLHLRCLTAGPKCASDCVEDWYCYATTSGDVPEVPGVRLTQ